MDDIDTAIGLLPAQRQSVTDQKSDLTRRDSLYREQAERYFREYISTDHQLAQLKRQLPVNYLTDGTIYKGFNEKGKLVAVFDKYENMLTVEYDESGKITAVYDGEDKQIVLSAVSF